MLHSTKKSMSKYSDSLYLNDYVRLYDILSQFFNNYIIKFDFNLKKNK